MGSRVFFSSKASKEDTLLYDRTKSRSWLDKLNSLSKNSMDVFNNIYERTRGAITYPTDTNLPIEGEDIPILEQTRISVSKDFPIPSDKNFSRNLDIIFDSISGENIEPDSNDINVRSDDNISAAYQLYNNSNHLRSYSGMKSGLPTISDGGTLEAYGLGKFKCQLNQAMPAISEAFNIIMERGLEIPGIFYGDNIRPILPYIQKYNNGVGLDLKKEQDIFLVAQVLKTLVSELEEHLLTKRLYPLFEKMISYAKKDLTTKNKLEDLLGLLPKSNLEALRMLFLILAGIINRQKGVVHIKEMTNTYTSMLHISNELFYCLLERLSSIEEAFQSTEKRDFFEVTDCATPFDMKVL